MVILGLLLLLLAIAAGALAIYGLPSGHDITWHFWNNSITLSPTMIFFIGVASAVALALGLWLMSLGARSSARKRRELKQLRRDQKDADRRDREHSADMDRVQREQADKERTIDHERTQRARAEQANREQSRLLDQDRRDGGASSVERR